MNIRINLTPFKALTIADLKPGEAFIFRGTPAGMTSKEYIDRVEGHVFMVMAPGRKNCHPGNVTCADLSNGEPFCAAPDSRVQRAECNGFTVEAT